MPYSSDLLQLPCKVFAVIAIFSICGCRKGTNCPNVLPDQHALSEADKKKLVHSIKDTLYFLRDGKDTLVFTGIKDQTFTTTDEEGDAGCITHRDEYENRSLDFRSTNGWEKLIWGYMWNDNHAKIYLETAKNSIQGAYSNLGWKPYDMDSITINGIQYRNISKVVDDFFSSTYFLYTTTDGLIYIKGGKNTFSRIIK